MEASIFVTGAAVQWLRDALGVIDQADETEELAASLDSNDGVYLVPAFVGLGSPYWDSYARGTITGLTRGTGRAHLARAALESIAYQTLDAVRAMEKASGEPLEELRADGGATENRWLMQFQADLLGVPVVVPEVSETTAMGAAFLAGVATGVWSEDDVRAMWREGARYEPSMADSTRETSSTAGTRRSRARRVTKARETGSHRLGEGTGLQGPASGRALRPLPRAYAEPPARTGCTSSCASCSRPTCCCSSARARSTPTRCPRTGRRSSPPTTSPSSTTSSSRSTCGARCTSWPSRSCSRSRCSSSTRHGGVFPVRRGHQDEEAFKTAHAVLARGDIVVMYCEGGRSRSGELGEAKPGIGRLALESGAPVVPAAIAGSERARNWKKGQFPKVTVQFGDPVRFEQVDEPTKEQSTGRGQRGVRPRQGPLRTASQRRPAQRRARRPRRPQGRPLHAPAPGRSQLKIR